MRAKLLSQLHSHGSGNRLFHGLAEGQNFLAVYLVGLHNPCSDQPPYPERGFKCERFRPLDELTEEEILALSKPVEETVS